MCLGFLPLCAFFCAPAWLCHTSVSRVGAGGCAVCEEGVHSQALFRSPDIRDIDFVHLKACGAQAIIFDKDNCLTRP